MTPDTVTRVRPAQDATERDTLTGLLDYLRATVVLKVAGLTDEQAFAHPVPASALTPAGLVQHLTGVERFWFSIDFAGLDVPAPWTDDAPGAFEPAAQDTLAGLVEAYRAECARSSAVVAAADLDDRARADGCDFTLRYALAHMVEETARHCGHLDLLRESTDGTRGL
ncbi:DinB family protein [Cellulomonas sp.]|uniref:DinB family protein n=1 Tax=Cellulomonas sp. TaxID=40001 RepID=UPI00281117BA|nr:DinB family protein [Cellulomonas sp.]